MGPAHAFTRRAFLVDGVRFSATVPLVVGPLVAGPLVAEQIGRIDEGTDEPTLVVVQLTGGNDALNTVVPFRQDDYFRARPLLGLPPKALHRFDDDHGLHPALRGVGGLAQDGLVAVLHGVGTPSPERSHFRALEVWHTAEPEAPTGAVGWLGHLADQLARARPGSMPALAVGGRELVLSMRGAEVVPPTLADDRGFTLAPAAQRLAAQRDSLLAPRAADASAARVERDLALVRETARTAYAAAERMQTLVATRPGVSYPDRPLARDLRMVARLIAGGFGTRIFHASLGGFDTHANQAAVHAALLDELDGALAAFQRDLLASGVAQRVVTVVFSEFSRRVAENGSRGTDHGHGGAVLVLGPKVVAGAHGAAPDLARLVDGDVPATTDFRGVYRRLEHDWMGLAPRSRAAVDAPAFLS